MQTLPTIEGVGIGVNTLKPATTFSTWALLW
jgi:hypothetical protein